MAQNPNDNLIVRLFERSDHESLASLMGELGYATRASEMEMRMEVIRQDSRYTTFVAVLDGMICGMIGTFVHQTYEHNGPGGRILALVVATAARGRGVGRALIAAAENDFAQKNVRRITLNTRFERDAAHQFYEKVGYTRTGFRFAKTLAALAD
jgi:ribosomal protein S18 acetylase RimI-like enzyme